MKLYSPREAGLTADYPGPLSWRPPDGYVFHYPGVDVDYTGDLDESFRALRGYERTHIGLNWGRLAYDYWVDLGGHAGVARGAGRSGATSGDYDNDDIPNNDETDAILLIYGTGQTISPEMRRTVGELVAYLGRRRDYVGHLEASPHLRTACPGQPAMNDIVLPLRAGDTLLDEDEDDMPLNDDDKRWLREMVRAEVDDAVTAQVKQLYHGRSLGEWARLAANASQQAVNLLRDR